MHCVPKFIIQGYYLQGNGTRKWKDWSIATNLEQARGLRDTFKKIIRGREDLIHHANATRIVKRVTRDEVLRD